MAKHPGKVLWALLLLAAGWEVVKRSSGEPGWFAGIVLFEAAIILFSLSITAWLPPRAALVLGSLSGLAFIVLTLALGWQVLLLAVSYELRWLVIDHLKT